MKKRSEAGAIPDADTVMSLIGTIGDTTWRMFVPSVGLTLVGVWLDGQLSTKPWLMTVGILLGFAGAYLLVKKQISGLKREGRSKR